MKANIYKPIEEVEIDRLRRNLEVRRETEGMPWDEKDIERKIANYKSHIVENLRSSATPEMVADGRYQAALREMANCFSEGWRCGQISRYIEKVEIDILGLPLNPIILTSK